MGLDYNVLDLVSGDLVIDAVRINEPRILVKRGPDGLNPQDIIWAQGEQ